MKASQHTAEQIIKILEQAEKGDQTIGAICRTNGIAENTFYRWRKTYGGMSVSEAQRLKELEKENTRLKRLLAERMLEVDALKELLGKKHEHHRTTGGGALPQHAGRVGAMCLRAPPAPARNVSVSTTPGRERRRGCGTERPGTGAATLRLSTDHPEGTRHCCGGNALSIQSACIACGSARLYRCSDQNTVGSAASVRCR
jgi:putative transposase